MAAAAILDFRNSEFLFADGIWRPQTHHCTKFCQNRSFRYGDIAIFRIFKIAAAANLDFWNREILLVTGVQSVEMHQQAKFCLNRLIGCKDIKIFPFRFFKMTAVRHFGFVWGIFGPPTVSTLGLYHSAKFGWGFGAIWSHKRVTISTKAKKHTLAWVRVIWAIKRENVVSGLTCRCVA